MKRSATVADQVVLKQDFTLRIVVEVQQPWQIKWFSNLWVWICRLNWAFLFQRTAKSARSSCFCDPPGRFFDRAIGSPQAYIPAPTAVWTYYSNVFGIETYTYTRNLPWNGYASKIKTATVVDDGLQPKSTASWFTNCKSITQCDMSKLDTSTLADASGMFYNCSSLTTIGDLSGWDVSNLANFDGSNRFLFPHSNANLVLQGEVKHLDR